MRDMLLSGFRSFRVRLARLVLASCAAACLSSPTHAATPSDSNSDFYARAGREISSKHYRILSDLDPESTRNYATHLDLIYEEYAQRLSGLSQKAPEIPFVLMFAHQADYLDVLKRTYGIDAKGSGGMFFISPGGAALAFFTESLPESRVLHVIQHEGFYQYAHSRFVGTLPPWLNEGLAEYFGEAIVIDGRVIIGQASPGPVETIKKAIDQGQTIDFLRLLTMTPDDWNGNVRNGSAAIQYMQAWSMVQFLGWAENGRYQAGFERYLVLIHDGMPSDRAFVQAFGTNDVKSFETTWKEWARNMKPSALGTAALRITFLAEGLAMLSHEGVKVESLDDLVTKLRERNFATEVTVHGRSERMEANDTVLQIPKDELAKEQPVFDLIPAKVGKSTTSDRKREADHPTPPVITTRGMQPRELVLKWTRLKSGDFDFELLSPNKAPPPPKAKPDGKSDGKSSAVPDKSKDTGGEKKAPK